MKLTIVLAVALTILVAGCGGDDDDSSAAQSSAASAPKEGFSGSGDAADSVGSQGNFHGKVSLHYNAYGDYGHCSGGGFGQLDCFGTYEASPDNTPPFCCNNRGRVHVSEVSRPFDPHFCGAPGTSCPWRITFSAPGDDFLCYVTGAGQAECYTDRDQPADRLGEPGGPLRLYVGKNQVFGVHGYVP